MGTSGRGLATQRKSLPFGEKGLRRSFEMVDARSIPQYDLSAIPQKFKSLRDDASSGPKQWALAIAQHLGPDCVRAEGDYHIVVFNGMGYRFQTTRKQQPLQGSHKKYLMNALAHMHVF